MLADQLEGAMTEEDEEFERIASRCKETKRVNESKWNSEMCSNYGGFCKKEWVGLTAEDMKDERTHNFDFIHGARWAEKILKGRNT